eukprot:gnl/MRDRNA2_/MRDRNA2_82332_c0_seq1.p1 gnl/MRDRNA2_/MRDRNA2_82332_c0~~gnl/MRDRNA2_/MRDRNA2_82332_c0_seq1.p1  ORF type:complete len:237 (-),score=39.79 gnl/MRDRNA2_/MRDRNA2_82332_c0_seq1:5-715(-)
MSASNMVSKPKGPGGDAYGILREELTKTVGRESLTNKRALLTTQMGYPVEWVDTPGTSASSTRRPSTELNSWDKYKSKDVGMHASGHYLAVGRPPPAVRVHADGKRSEHNEVFAQRRQSHGTAMGYPVETYDAKFEKHDEAKERACCVGALGDCYEPQSATPRRAPGTQGEREFSTVLRTEDLRLDGPSHRSRYDFSSLLFVDDFKADDSSASQIEAPSTQVCGMDCSGRSCPAHR